MLNPIAALKQTVRIFFMSFADLWKVKMAVVTFFAYLVPISFPVVMADCGLEELMTAWVVIGLSWPITTVILTLLVVCATNLQFLLEKPRGQKMTWTQMGNFIWKRLLILLSGGLGLSCGFIGGVFIGGVFIGLLKPTGISITVIIALLSTLFLFILSDFAMSIVTANFRIDIYRLIYCLVFYGLLYYAALFLVRSRLIPISRHNADCPANPWELATISAATLALITVHLLATLVRLQKENA